MWPSTARAAVIVTAVQNGGNVVFSTVAGGSLDLTGTFGGGTLSWLVEVDPSNQEFIVGYSPPGSQGTARGGVTGPGAFGTGTVTAANTFSGDVLGAGATYVVVPEDYINNAPLAGGTATYFGSTFASLGMAPGTYVWTLPNDTLTLEVQAIPVPTAVWLFGSAIGLLGWLRRSTD